MSSVPIPASHSSAQMAAQEQARAVADAVREHRRAFASMANSRSGMCMADDWNVSYETLDGDFAIDATVIERLLGGAPLQRGPWMRAAPGPGRPSAAPSGPSALEAYLFPPPPTGAPGSLERLGEEAASAVWGPGNIAANSTAALAGALRGAGEASGARRFADGLRDVLDGRAKVVKIAPNIELYNAAQGRQPPRARLRVRGLTIKVVRQAIPATGGPVTQWRLNGPGTSASLKTSSMNAQQMRNMAVLAGERQLPTLLRGATTNIGSGVLTFAPSLLLDAYRVIWGDLQGGGMNAFLVAQARSQSGNLVGFVGGMVAVAAVGGAMAGAPLVLFGLVIGTGLQLGWNATGLADGVEGLAKAALTR